MWAPVGQQPEVPAPGKNYKHVVYGGVDYATSKISCTMAATKSGTNFLVFLMMLVRVYAGRKVRLVCDNGRFHHTKAVYQWLAEHRDVVEVFWLPPYCPSLNLIERLWKFIKKDCLNGRYYPTHQQFQHAVLESLAAVNTRHQETLKTTLTLEWHFHKPQPFASKRLLARGRGSVR